MQRIINATSDENTVLLDLVRSFGLHNTMDRKIFAVMTGRLQFIQRAIRAALDRRRRQAYQILRRIQSYLTIKKPEILSSP